MSLTQCITKAGKALSRENKAAIMAASRKYRQQGMSPDEAGIKAVDDRIAEVRALLEAAAKAPAPQDQPVVASAPADARQTAAVEPERKAEPGADSAAAEGSGLDIFEPGAAYDVAIAERAVYSVKETGETSDVPLDLFPETLDGLQRESGRVPTGAGRIGARAKRQAASSRDIQSAPPVPNTLAIREDAEFPGVYHYSTQLVEVGRRDLPVSRVTNWREAASALQALRRYAVEHFDALVTGADGKPLAVIGAFKGARSRASVEPSTMLQEALRIKGAAKVWGVHNHPSGIEMLSAADLRLSVALAKAFEPSSVRWMGLAAVGDGRFEAVDGSAIRESSTLLGEGSSTVSVPIVERTIAPANAGMPVIDSPDAARRVTAGVSNGKPGIVFVDSQHRIAAWVPVDPAGMATLRQDGRFDRLINAASNAGAGAAVIANPAGSMDMRTLRNIVSALDLADVKVLDAIDTVTGDSLAERGMLPGAAGTVLSRAPSMVGSSAFRAWFGDSKIVGDDGKARVMYHGTGRDITAFRPKQAGAIFLTDEPFFAQAYAETSDKWIRARGERGGANIMPVYVKAENPFDFDNPAHRADVVDAVFAADGQELQDGSRVVRVDPDSNRSYTKEQMLEELQDPDNWALIEEEWFQRAIKSLGHDSFFVNEGGFKNLGVYEPTQVKSAIGNRGTFDPKNPDIRLSGGAAERAGGIDQVALQSVVDRVKARLPGLPKVNVLSSPAALKSDGAQGRLKAYLEERGATADAEGAVHEGEIYLFASGIADETRAEHVLAEHEVAHAGLLALLGSDMQKIMRSIADKNASVRKAATSLMKDDPGLDLLQAVEEAIVDIPSANLARLNGWRDMVSKVRDWLGRHGFEKLAEHVDRWLSGTLSDQRRADLFVADLVREARAFFAKAGADEPNDAVVSGRGGATLSRAKPRPEFGGRRQNSEGAELRKAKMRNAIADAMAKAGISGVNVVESVDDLPADKRDVVLSSEPSGNIRGAYFKDDDSVWIVSGNIKSAKEMIFVAMHEAFHRGLARTLGPDAKRVLKGMYLTNGRLRELADQQRATHKIGLYEAIEEALADLAGHGKARDLRGWDKLLKMIRSWLGKFADAVGVQITWTDGMIEDFVAGMRREGMSGDAKITTTLPASIQRVIDAVGKDFKTHEQALAHLKERGFAVRRDEHGAVVVVDSKGADVPYSDAPRDIVHAWNILAIDEQMDPDGDFDSPVAFSRSAKAFSSLRAAKLPAGYIVNDFIKSSGKVGWWSKTVGTMHNLAERSPAFRKVYDAANAFINDVSFYATEAADKAPTLLPKLETIRDLTKSPLSPEDTKAISAPIFQGTLSWTRDKSGAPVQESDPQKAGIVWTDAELAKKFGFSPRQIGLYREFRDSVDLSLKNLAVSDMLSLGGKDLAHLADAAMAAKTVGEAAQMMKTALADMAYVASPDRAAILADTGEKIGEKAEQAQRLMDRGYAPLMRYGHYTLDVVDKDGERIYFGLFESERDANKMAREMLANNPGATVTQGTMSEKAYQMFAGVSPETLELFGNMLGLESQGDEAASNAFQEYLKLVKANRSAMKRLIERKGTAGFSEDAGRVLAGFVYSNARQTSKNLHFGNLTRATNDIAKDKSQGELRDVAGDLRQYITNPREEAQKIRGLMFAQFLGGSVASAMVNLTQPVAVTFPYLSQFGGAMKAAAQMKRALSDALKWESQRLKSKRTTGDKALDAALHRAEEDGIVSPQEVHQLIAQAGGSAALRAGDGTAAGNAIAAAQNRLSKLMLLWGRPFAVAEQFNRRATFIAAYRVAVDQKMADPFKFAEKAIMDTQFNYTKANRPQWARGAIGATLFTFKQYSISYVELMTRLARSGPEGRKAAAIGLAVLFLMSGLQGLPGADDLDDLIDAAMQRLGYNWNTKAEKRELLASIVGDGGAQFLMRGVSGLPGVPIDVAGRLGLGNLIPGTGVLTKKDDYTRDVLEVLGPAGSLAQQVGKGAAALAEGEVARAAKEVLPVAAANAVKAADMWSTGMYRDSRGRKVIDTDAIDAVFKAIGFQPNDVARVQRATQEVQSMVSQARLREAEIADKWARGMFEQNRDIVDDARAELERWNDRNPESRIKITSAQLVKRLTAMRQDKAQRLAKTAPAEMRNTVRKELAGIK